jgi:hypothetical protein
LSFEGAGCAITHSVIALSRADSSPIKGEQGQVCAGAGVFSAAASNSAFQRAISARLS